MFLLVIFIPIANAEPFIASADPFTDWFRGLFGITGKAISCKGSTHLESGKCVSNSQACTASCINGVGSSGRKTWNGKTYSACSATACSSCKSGYKLSGGKCVASVASLASCTPNCNRKACGVSDGCGGYCSRGSCPSPQTCSAVTPNVCGCTAAAKAVAVKNCAKKACGASDGCGGYCGKGTCSTGKTCQNGVCVQTEKTKTASTSLSGAKEKGPSVGPFEWIGLTRPVVRDAPISRELGTKGSSTGVYRYNKPQWPIALRYMSENEANQHRENYYDAGARIKDIDDLLDLAKKGQLKLSRDQEGELLQERGWLELEKGVAETELNNERVDLKITSESCTNERLGWKCRCSDGTEDTCVRKGPNRCEQVNIQSPPPAPQK